MLLITEKGEYESFAELRADYILSQEDMALDPKHIQAKPWGDSLLHASDLGACPRKAMLRLLETPHKIQSSLTMANNQLMWWMGYRVHYLTYEAMDWAGILHSHERDLFDPPWSGSYDALFWPDFRDKDRLMGYDCKTTRPKGYNYAYSFPKEPHVIQVSGYGLKTPAVREWVIEYVYFGSTKPPVICVVNADEHEDKVLDAISGLELAKARMVDDPEELPPVMPEKLVAHYRKNPKQEDRSLVSVTYDCNWQCGYCPYVHTVPPKNDDDHYPAILPDSPCKPPWHEPLQVMKITKKRGVEYPAECPAGEDAVLAFYDSQLKTVPIIGGQDEEDD